jgi:hypothetical protein
MPRGSRTVGIKHCYFSIPDVFMCVCMMCESVSERQYVRHLLLCVIWMGLSPPIHLWSIKRRYYCSFGVLWHLYRSLKGPSHFPCARYTNNPILTLQKEPIPMIFSQSRFLSLPSVPPPSSLWGIWSFTTSLHNSIILGTATSPPV